MKIAELIGTIRQTDDAEQVTRLVEREGRKIKAISAREAMTLLSVTQSKSPVALEMVFNILEEQGLKLTSELRWEKAGRLFNQLKDSRHLLRFIRYFSDRKSERPTTAEEIATIFTPEVVSVMIRSKNILIENFVNIVAFLKNSGAKFSQEDILYSLIKVAERGSLEKFKQLFELLQDEDGINISEDFAKELLRIVQYNRYDALALPGFYTFFKESGLVKNIAITCGSAYNILSRFLGQGSAFNQQERNSHIDFVLENIEVSSLPDTIFISALLRTLLTLSCDSEKIIRALKKIMWNQENSEEVRKQLIDILGEKSKGGFYETDDPTLILIELFKLCEGLSIKLTLEESTNLLRAVGSSNSAYRYEVGICAFSNLTKYLEDGDQAKLIATLDGSILLNFHLRQRMEGRIKIMLKSELIGRNPSALLRDVMSKTHEMDDLIAVFDFYKVERVEERIALIATLDVSILFSSYLKAEGELKALVEEGLRKIDPYSLLCAVATNNVGELNVVLSLYQDAKFQLEEEQGANLLRIVGRQAHENIKIADIFSFLKAHGVSCGGKNTINSLQILVGEGATIVFLKDAIRALNAKITDKNLALKLLATMIRNLGIMSFSSEDFRDVFGILFEPGGEIDPRSFSDLLLAIENLPQGFSWIVDTDKFLKSIIANLSPASLDPLLASLDPHFLFIFYNSLTSAQCEFAKRKIKEHCDQYGAGSTLFTVISKGFGVVAIIKSLETFKDVLKIDSDDPYIKAVINDLASRTIGQLLLKSLIESLLHINSDATATASIRLDPPIRINLSPSEDASVELRYAKDVVFMMHFFPHLITDKVKQELAANTNVIQAINNTLAFHNAPYISAKSCDLFVEINLKIPDQDLRIKVEKLHSLRGLLATQRAFPKKEKLPETKLAESTVFKAIHTKGNFTFDQFYSSLCLGDRKALNLFCCGEDEIEIMTQWLNSNLEDLERNLALKPRPDLSKMLSWTAEQRAQSQERQQLSTLIIEIKDLANLSGEERNVTTVSCFKKLFASKNEEEKAGLPEPIRIISGSIDNAESTQAVKANWGKFRDNLNNLKELATLCLDEEEFMTTISATLALITQPNCSANLAILLQRLLESKRYDDPNHRAIAMALFEAAMPFLNSAGDVIMTHTDLSKILTGNGDIFLPENQLFYLIGKELARGKEPKEEPEEEVFGFGDEEPEEERIARNIAAGKMVLEAIQGAESSTPSSIPVGISGASLFGADRGAGLVAV